MHDRWVQPVQRPVRALDASGTTGTLQCALTTAVKADCPVRLQFANPTDLNGASSWVFINSPENVQHVCLDNVRNYTRRYLPACSKEPFLLPSHVDSTQSALKELKPPGAVTTCYLHRYPVEACLATLCIQRTWRACAKTMKRRFPTLEDTERSNRTCRTSINLRHTRRVS